MFDTNLGRLCNVQPQYFIDLNDASS